LIFMKRKPVFLILLAIVLLFMVAGCASPTDESEPAVDETPAEEEATDEDEVSAEARDDTPLVFADAGWDSIRLHNHIAGFIIENGYGYKTDVILGTTPITFAGLRTGDIDIYMEFWHDNFPDAYAEAIELGEIEVTSVNFDDNAQGLYVPVFLVHGDEERGIEPLAPDLKSVFDLPKYKDLFDNPEDPDKGLIVGSPPGWFADEVLSAKMVHYELDEHFTYFRPGSDTALATSITRAMETGEPWVGYYWEPTWIMGKYDMVLLEEPAYDPELWEDDYRCAFPSTEITTGVHRDMLDRAPDVVEFLRNYETSSEITSEALSYMMVNEVEADEAALFFLREYDELWTDWVPDDIAEKVLNALQ